MHISEGVFSAPVLLVGAGLAVAGTAVGLKRIDYDRLMTVAIMSSSFFIASLIHVPLGPSSAHLILNGLLGLVLGWAAFPAILTALFLQSVFFQFGGLTVLGVNTFNMAAPALICYYIFRSPISRPGKARGAAAFAGGALAVLLSSLFTAFSLAFTHEGFMAAAKLLVAAHAPIMLVEGVITMFAVTFLARVQPEILYSSLVK